MEKNPNDHNSDIGHTGQTETVSENLTAQSTDSSSGSHHRSSHGSSGSSHGSSSNSHHHSSSGSHHSSSGSHHSSSHGSSSSKSSAKSTVSLFKRVRHKIKYLYWKYKRRFTKASRIKKAGYVVIVLIAIILLAILMKLALQSTNNTETTTDTYVYSTQTTVPITTEKPAAIPPGVVTYYEINDTYKVDEVFSSGFMVELPNIVSSKPLAIKINAEMDKIKEAVKKTYNSVDNIKAYREQYNYSYDSYVKDNILFLSVFTAHGKKSSDFITSNKYYAYDFEADKLIDDGVIINMFNLDITQILDIVNSALIAVGAAPIDNINNIRFFVKDSGKLFADVKVNALLGGTYSELVQLT